MTSKPDTHSPPTTAAEAAAASHASARLMHLSTYAAVSVASLLLLLKLFAWWRTGSLSMLSSFTDSVFDLVMSVANLFAVRYALKPADDDHRFGHNSIEDIAGLAQCAFIFAAMAMIVLQSIARLANPVAALEHPGIGIAVSIIGMVITTVLVLFQTYVSRRTRSLVIAADRLHYASDILFNLGVLAAFGLSGWGNIPWADGAIAILIAFIVIWSNLPIGVRAFNNLMNREMPDEEKSHIVELVAGMPEIRGHHKLKTRYSGIKPFIQLHAEIDAALNFREAHAIIDRLENAILQRFPGADVIVHPDPVDSSSQTTSRSTHA